MQAIRTKYCGPTNTRGSRIQASCEAKTIYVPYDHALNRDGNHRAACEELMRVMAEVEIAELWAYSDMVGGWHGDAMYWVFVNGWDRTNVNSASNEVAA
jgi:hypothetical protein